MSQPTYIPPNKPTQPTTRPTLHPTQQGGPHNHQIGALAVALKYAASPEFVAYQKQVVANCRALAARLIKHGYHLVTGGTDNHLVLWDLRPIGISGGKVRWRSVACVMCHCAGPNRLFKTLHNQRRPETHPRLAPTTQKQPEPQMEKACDLCHITLNKNSVLGDLSAFTPGGVRIGTPAMTSRGLLEADFEQVADFLHEVVQVCEAVQAKTGAKLIKDFVAALDGSEEVAALRARVEAFSATFAMPGFSTQGLE